MNPYELLGLKEDCTDEDITKAFRELSKVNHPDMGGDSEMFIRISIAVEVLRDPYRRKLFDEHGIFSDKSEEIMNSNVMSRFHELTNAWIDSQMQMNKDIPIKKFFTTKIMEGESSIANKINELKLYAQSLGERKGEVAVSEGENLVQKIIQNKIDMINNQKDQLSQELIIIKLLKEICDKYSSEDIQENMMSSSTSTNTQVFYQFSTNGHFR